MTDLADFLARIDALDTPLRLGTPREARSEADAVLFDAVQVPIVALAILVNLTLRKNGKVALSKIGERVGLTLMEAFPQFGTVGLRLDWSLRVRAVASDAIAFLEESTLACVIEGESTRTVVVSAQGRQMLRKMDGGDAEAKGLLAILRSAASTTRNDRLELE